MKSQTIGQAVRSAYDVLWYFTEDLAALSKSLEQQMDAAYWSPAITPRIRPWNIELAYFALYTPSARKKAPTQHAIMLQTNLWAEASVEPLLLAVACRFNPALQARDIWNVWHRKGGERVMTFVCEHGGEVEIPLAELKPDFAPQAKQAVGFAIKVCELTGPDELSGKLVKPILECARKCGYQRSAVVRR